MNPLPNSPQSGLPGKVVFAGLAPHAPILIPEIGGARLENAAASVGALKQFSTRLVNSKPDSVILVSPHSPRKPHAFGIWSCPRLTGNFHRFNAPEISLDFPNDLALDSAIESEATRAGLSTWHITKSGLDHGALVPLWYLKNAGWDGPTSVLSLNYPGDDGETNLGKAIASAARNAGRRLAILASGDMSHRLTVDSPAGYQPQGAEFDSAFIASLRRGSYRDLETINSKLLELAGEDAVDSTLVAVAAADWQSTGHEVLSYEGPFGVGYGVAILYDESANLPPNQPPLDWAEGRQAVWSAVLPAVAREALQNALTRSNHISPIPDHPCLAERHGVFVTIRDTKGRLRGCVGTILPRSRDVVEETRQMSCAAGLRDGRMSPVEAVDLPNLHFEVSVLGPLEEVPSASDLDPEHFGLVVETSDHRRGCLLPAIREIRTAEDQVAIARRKAGIDPAEPVKLFRFETVKLSEPHPAER